MNTRQHTPLRAGLLGEHLSHSFSPQIHKALVGNRFTYEIYERDPADLETFIKDTNGTPSTLPFPTRRRSCPIWTRSLPRPDALGR